MYQFYNFYSKSETSSLTVADYGQMEKSQLPLILALVS